MKLAKANKKKGIKSPKKPGIKKDKTKIGTIIIRPIVSIFGILTMFHSAFRIALPGFIYGLSYVVLHFRKS